MELIVEKVRHLYGEMLALIWLVAAEMIGAFVLQAGNMMQTDRLLGGVALLSILGLLISALISRLEARLLRWR